MHVRDCLGLIFAILLVGSPAWAANPADSPSQPIPKLLPGYPKSLDMDEVETFIARQKFGFPGCTRRVRFEGKERSGSREYYQTVQTPWQKDQVRVTVTYVFVGNESFVMEVQVGQQWYWREDRGSAVFHWDQRLPWER